MKQKSAKIKKKIHKILRIVQVFLGVGLALLVLPQISYNYFNGGFHVELAAWAIGVAIVILLVHLAYSFSKYKGVSNNLTVGLFPIALGWIFYVFIDVVVDTPKAGFKKVSGFGELGQASGILAVGLTALLLWMTITNLLQQISERRIDKFEDTFFSMAKTLREIALEITLANGTNGLQAFKYYYSVEILDWAQKSRCNTLNVFPFYPSLAPKNITPVKFIKSYREEIIKKVIVSEDYYLFDHYFRYFYRILKFVEGSHDKYPLHINKEIVTDLLGILRSQLSPYELVMIFYNGIIYYEKDDEEKRHKLKELLETHGMLNNLRPELVANYFDTRLYAATAFGRDKYDEFHQRIKKLILTPEESSKYLPSYENIGDDVKCYFEARWEDVAPKK